MAFFKSFQTNLPSVNISSILDSVTSRVDDLANAVSDATYAVSDQLTEQVTTIINKVDEGDNTGSQGGGQTAAGQENKSRNNSIWQMARESETSNTVVKTNQASDTAEAESNASQLEWEWRDGCWRVKKTEAELAEEEMKKQEEKEQQERKEQRRRERREKQLEKEGKLEKNREESQNGEQVEEPGDNGASDRKASDSGDQQRADDCDEPPETKSSSSKEKKHQVEEEEEEQEEAMEDSLEREGDDEEDAELSKSSSTVKKKKSEKKKAKGAKRGSKKSQDSSDAEKVKGGKEKVKKSKKKKKKNKEGVVSDSEEEKGPEAVAQQNTTSAWSSKHKQSNEQGGYSSEASSERASSIQRIRKDSSLNEHKPPPYQDEGSAARVSSRSRSERGVRRGTSPQRGDSARCSSEASVDQDTESYLNKGCEEDIPSDSTAVLGPEDGSGPQLPTAYEPEALGKYGTLDVAFEYDSSEQYLAVTVTAATDIPALKQTGNIAWQVHLVLLPTKKQRAKTGVQKGPCPVFTETFKFSRVEQEALGDYAVRFRLYSIRRMKKEKVLGEKVFYLTKLNLQGKIALPVTLEPGSELTGCGSLVSVSRSAGALSYRSTEDSSLPEILLGLIYNSATGQLSAEVIQGSHFKTTASDKPVNGLFCCIKHFVGGQLYIMRDTYVKLTMLDSKGKEMSKCKTAVCRGQPNPTYKETFVFQVALFQLSEVSLVLTVFCRRSSMRPRERLGWVSLGLNSSSEEQQAHWTEMKEAEGQQVCHWHTLTDT
ncbi:synaptotagmin-14b isoform X1 [Larimichthys crocea]|uniref:synaptotagmin-14b isoform X1 n=1 Tax=Larimichthys crocea TaxID=215358 RepID=UPI000F5FECC0|nr:synaptotagmin-14 isoform X1 [Larimichthys crocea]XP_027139657.1 synaptotagmin-14 isoform X1 [Larimichthys crocea]XP_027139658.1 synaptotagmin-14 isoform X1 [Larimichthys crocea]XP_027139659.1 synaptotagmin-14 isoform X1 [Larimichthys crocea]XP_027139660.1 synaptotagmin-14 isoform X1 [Larimichthys crocea]